MIKVIKSGFFTSIQDQGRFGYRQYGVPISGAMDKYSCDFANAILGNTKDAAVLEITMVGPILQFTKQTRIVISGAVMNPKVNNVSVAMNSVIYVKANDILSFGMLTKGCRSYVAVKGGIISDMYFGSKSMFNNISESTHLAEGEVLNYMEDNDLFNMSNAHVKYDNTLFNSNCLEVIKGPEFYNLSEKLVEKLLNSTLKVSKLNNRMAYQLEPLIENTLEPILTSPVLPGTVQLTPKGQLIILMRDCQTTGGYPRIFQLTENSINSLSQKITGNNLKISLKE